MIETTRCILTGIRISDLNHAIKLFTDPDVRRFLGGPVDIDTGRKTVVGWTSSDTADHRWVVRAKADGSFIGVISLSRHHNGVDTEISYLLLPNWWGRAMAPK